MGEIGPDIVTEKIEYYVIRLALLVDVIRGTLAKKEKLFDER